MCANFTPVYKEISEGRMFRFWCQKVLPLVYDDSLSYYELLCKVVNYLNEVIKNTDTIEENVRSLYTAFSNLQEYVNEYFETLDVDEVVIQEFNKLAESGFFGKLLFGYHTYKEFGAVMDGITNDYAAVKACHDAANADGLPVINFGGTIYIGGTGINVKTDCIFYGTKIIVDSGASDYVYNIAHDASGNVEKITLNSVFTDANTVAEAYKNKFFVIDTTISVGSREGTGTPGYISFPCIADEKGNSIFPLPNYADLSGEVVDVTHISLINEKGIRFGGCSFKSNGNVTPHIVKVNRNNTLVENIYVEYEAKSSDGYGAAILLYECCKATVNNITTKYTCPVYSYGVCVWRSYGAVINSLKGSDEWASFAANTINTLTVRDCCMERFDVHENQYGVCTANACSLLYAHVGFGYGKTVFDSCKITNGVDYRNDYHIFYMGDISILNCDCETVYRDNRLRYDTASTLIKLVNARILIDSCRSNSLTIYEGHRVPDLPYVIITVRNMEATTNYYAQSECFNRYVFENCIVTDTSAPIAARFVNCKVTVAGVRDTNVEHEYINCHVNMGWNPASLKVRAYNTEFISITNNNNIACFICYNCYGLIPVTGNYVGIDGGKFTGHSGYTNSSRGGYIKDCFLDSTTYRSMINNNTAPARINITDGANLSGLVTGTNTLATEPTFELLRTF